MKALRRLHLGFGHLSSTAIAYLHRYVRDYIRSFLICQKNKTEHFAGLLQPLPVPDNIWSDITMDFVEGFPRVGGKSVVLTIVD